MMEMRGVSNRRRRAFALCVASLCFASAAISAGAGETPIAEQLAAAYPGIIKEISGNAVVFADGSTLPFDDGKGVKPFEQWLDDADIEDMFAQAYVKGAVPPPGPQHDPGRARNEAFFLKVYGDCRKGEVAPKLVDVIWLPGKARQVLKVSPINGMAERLRAVSAELDALPASFDRDLKTVASTYNCRVISGTKRLSAHAFGAAIDIAVRSTGYWRWQPPAVQAADHTKDLPPEIVAIFEKHGFIWGGKWRHFDTMHFEYRPELLPPETVTHAAADGAGAQKAPAP